MGPLHRATRAARIGAFLLASWGAGAAHGAIDFDTLPRIQDIASSPVAPGHLLLATQSGLLLAAPDGRVVPVALEGRKLAALVVDPTRPKRLFASGSDAEGDALGLMASEDGGLTWDTVGPGATGPAAYRALGVGVAAGQPVIYGSFGGLQRGRADGDGWTIVGRGPWDVYSLAVSTRDADRVYAAARGGLYASADGGATWGPAHPTPSVATALAARPGGEVWAFVLGRGLLRSREPGMAWETVQDDFGEQIPLKLAFDPRDARHLYVLNQFGRIVESLDGGATWRLFGGERGPATPEGERGRALYDRYCASCHGVRGVGEKTTEQLLSDPNYLRAPALDDSTHAWHHSDEDIVKSILSGSERSPRAPALAGKVTEAQAREIVAYIKSLWGPKALRCQGANHMRKDCK